MLLLARMLQTYGMNDSPVPLKTFNYFPDFIKTDKQKLLWALAANEIEAILLYTNKETANASDENGFSALHYAVLIDNPTAVNELINCGANIQKLTPDKKSIYTLAKEHKRSSIISYINANLNHEFKD